MWKWVAWSASDLGSSLVVVLVKWLNKKKYCLFLYFNKSTYEVTIKHIVKEQKWNHWLGIAQIITEVIRYIMYISDSRASCEASQLLCLHFHSHLCGEEKAVRVNCRPEKRNTSTLVRAWTQTASIQNPLHLPLGHQNCH